MCRRPFFLFCLLFVGLSWLASAVYCLDLSEARRQGYGAGRAGAPRKANPYGTEHGLERGYHYAWDDGWRASGR